MGYIVREHADWEQALDAASRLMRAYRSARELGKTADLAINLARVESDSLVQEDARRFLGDIIKIYSER